MAQTALECVWDLGALLGEGPVWHGDALWFVDIKRHQVHRFDPADGERRSWNAPEQVGFVLPDERGTFIAGLQSVPDELYDAANVDGAGPVRQFFTVTLPMLRPTLLFVSVITMIGYFQLFAEPYVMTQGGPLRSTTSVVHARYPRYLPSRTAPRRSGRVKR